MLESVRPYFVSFFADQDIVPETKGCVPELVCLCPDFYFCFFTCILLSRAFFFVELLSFFCRPRLAALRHIGPFQKNWSENSIWNSVFGLCKWHSKVCLIKWMLKRHIIIIYFICNLHLPKYKQTTESPLKTISIRGHSTTTWTKIWPISTPSPSWVDKRGHFTTPPPCPRGQKVDKSPPPPPLKYKKCISF